MLFNKKMYYLIFVMQLCFSSINAQPLQLDDDVQALPVQSEVQDSEKSWFKKHIPIIVAVIGVVIVGCVSVKFLLSKCSDAETEDDEQGVSSLEKQHYEKFANEIQGLASQIGLLKNTYDEKYGKGALNEALENKRLKVRYKGLLTEHRLLQASIKDNEKDKEQDFYEIGNEYLTSDIGILQELRKILTVDLQSESGSDSHHDSEQSQESTGEGDSREEKEKHQHSTRRKETPARKPETVVEDRQVQEDVEGVVNIIPQAGDQSDTTMPQQEPQTYAILSSLFLQ